MIKAIRFLYSIWGLLWFWILLILFYPIYLIPIINPKWKRIAYLPNKIIARLIFTSLFIPVKQEYRFKPDKKKPYIYCPNHNSYLDIPAIGATVKQFVVFMGKSSLAKIPLFGLMYKRIYILVNRKDSKSRYRAFELSKKAIDEGYSMVIYPEGRTNPNPPQLVKFKDGAFKVAIEKKVPIVPVTIPYNWKIFPDNTFLLKWNKIKVIYHEPIDTSNYTLNDLDLLKEETSKVISDELAKYFPEKFEIN